MSYHHLTIDERCCIYNFLNSHMSIRQIALALHRSPSSISREIKRNSISGHYFPYDAHELYDSRRYDCHRKRINDPQLFLYIESRIKDHWSPEQIAHRQTDEVDLPSTSTIYRIIHRNQIEHIQMKHLRRKGKFKRPAETRGKFNDGGRRITKRPKSIYKREELGHWEGDTVESGRNNHQKKSKYCFITLVERKSRYCIAILVPDRKEKHVTPAIIKALKNVPKDLVKTITFDRGKEFAGYEKIEEELECATYFCDPYCAWQKGTNENTNGLLREFYPKGMDLSKVDEKELESTVNLLNQRPRKCIAYQTPAEVLHT